MGASGFRPNIRRYLVREVLKKYVPQVRKSAFSYFTGPYTSVSSTKEFERRLGSLSSGSIDIACCGSTERVDDYPTM